MTQWSGTPEYASSEKGGNPTVSWYYQRLIDSSGEEGMQLAACANGVLKIVTASSISTKEAPIAHAQ